MKKLNPREFSVIDSEIKVRGGERIHRFLLDKINLRYAVNNMAFSMGTAVNSSLSHRVYLNLKKEMKGQN